MGTDQNPYQAYAEGSIFGDNPLAQVIALYEGALDAVKQAERALLAGEILARGKAINKANAILVELLVSLDYERGGEIARNLKALYCYMQQQLLTAHARKAGEPIKEVSALLATLLEGWRGAAQAPVSAPVGSASAPSKQQDVSHAPESGPYYGGYMDDSASGRLSTAYSF